MGGFLFWIRKGRDLPEVMFRLFVKQKWLSSWEEKYIISDAISGSLHRSMESSPINHRRGRRMNLPQSGYLLPPLHAPPVPPTPSGQFFWARRPVTDVWSSAEMPASGKGRSGHPTSEPSLKGGTWTCPCSGESDEFRRLRLMIGNA